MAFDSLFGRSKKQPICPRAAKSSRLNLEPLEDRRVLAAYINEIYFDPPSGSDVLYEYIELRGTANQSLDDYYLIFLENENNALNTGTAGSIEMIFDLSGQTFGSSSMRVTASAPAGGWRPEPRSKPAITTLSPPRFRP